MSKKIFYFLSFFLLLFFIFVSVINHFLLKNNIKKTTKVKEILHEVFVDKYFKLGNGKEMKIVEEPSRHDSQLIMKEIHKDYSMIDELKYKNGDIIFDIGAFNGVVSNYAALMHPEVKVYAFEPVDESYMALVRNIKANNTNIIPHKLGMSKDGRDLSIEFSSTGCKTCASAFSNYTAKISGEVVYEKVKTINLEEFIKKNNIKKIKLLKIDCEGCEYEVFENMSDECFSKIENVVGELHGSQQKMDNLEKLIKSKIKGKVSFNKFVMEMVH